MVKILLDGWVNGWKGEGGHDEGIVDRNVMVTTITIIHDATYVLSAWYEPLRKTSGDDLMKFGRFIDKL